MQKRLIGILSSCGLAICAATATPALAAVNLIDGHVDSIGVTGVHGVLKAGDQWIPNSNASNITAPVNGVFETEQHQWNNNSFWWDEYNNPDLQGNIVTWTLALDTSFTFDQLSLQADNNDDYLVEYFDGANWQSLWTASAVSGFGLMTRNTNISPITTSAFRISHAPNGAGDGYYAFSEFQAFGRSAVPEPAGWTMMIAGFGVVGAAMRRRRAKVSFA